MIKLDTTLLRPITLVTEIQQACKKAIDNGLTTVCVPPLFIKIAKDLLKDSAVKVATVIGYPYGYAPTEVKLSEIMLAIYDGADELYVTANIMAIKNNDWHYIAKELNQILPIIQSRDKVMKMLVDTTTLTVEEVSKCFKLIEPAGIEVISF